MAKKRRKRPEEPKEVKGEDEERLRPLSMAPLSLEEALRGAMQAPPPEDEEGEEPDEDEERPDGRR